MAAAVLMALGLLWVGLRLLSAAGGGLLDAAWPEPDIERFEQTLHALELEGAHRRAAHAPRRA